MWRHQLSEFIKKQYLWWNFKFMHYPNVAKPGRRPNLSMLKKYKICSRGSNMFLS